MSANGRNVMWTCGQARLVKPHGINLNRKNELLPFDDVTSLEFLLSKNDCALFAFANHNKKRPNNLIVVRRNDAGDAAVWGAAVAHYMLLVVLLSVL